MADDGTPPPREVDDSAARMTLREALDRGEAARAQSRLFGKRRADRPGTKP